MIFNKKRQKRGSTHGQSQCMKGDRGDEIIRDLKIMIEWWSTENIIKVWQEKVRWQLLQILTWKNT